MTRPSLAPAAATSLLSALQVPARGSRPPRPPRTRTSPHPFSGLPCVAAFACPFRTETRLADSVGKFSTGGETTLSAAPEGERESSVTTRSATLYALQFRNSPPYLLSWRNPVSFSPLSPLTLATLVPAWPWFSPPPILLVAALLTYGSHAASRDSPRHWTFLSHPSSEPPFSPPPTRPWLTCFMKSSLARTPSKTPPHRLPPWEHPSARSSWRPAAEGGPSPYVKLSRGFPPSHAPCVARPAAPPVTSASKLHSASAAPSRGKTRVQF